MEEMEIHAFLMIGQSNMAGRGFLNEAEPIQNDRIRVLKNGRWQPFFTPVNFDRPFAGISLAESFADAYSRDRGVTVGLIPCADGNTCLEDWKAGGLLFDHAVLQTRLAARTSRIAGILWHQGEGDCGAGRYPLYEERLTKILKSLREELDLYETPVLLGGLGDFLTDYAGSDDMKNYCFINQSLKRMAEKDRRIGFVSAEGLTANLDKLHFNAASLREFGRRYYREFEKVEAETAHA